MIKVTPEAIPDQLLHLKNAHKIAAATWVIEMVMKNRKAYTLHLNDKEAAKVQKEIDVLIEGISNKRRKWHNS